MVVSSRQGFLWSAGCLQGDQGQRSRSPLESAAVSVRREQGCCGIMCVKFSLKSSLEISEKEKNSFLTVLQFFLP